MNLTDLDQQFTGLAGLGDPIRRALYRYVAERGVPVSRDDAAQAAGISRPLAAYHRDLVCGANHAMLQALTDRLGGEPPVRAVLDPQPGRCCVTLTRDT